MILRIWKKPLGNRPGVTVVEVAVVAPLIVLMLIGLFVGATGTFRYQQIAALAREGARFAALRGPNYRTRTGNPLPTSSDVLAAIKPHAVGLKPELLSCSLTRTANDRVITVVLTYDWTPPAVMRPVQLKSTAVSPVLN